MVSSGRGSSACFPSTKLPDLWSFLFIERANVSPPAAGSPEMTTAPAHSAGDSVEEGCSKWQGVRDRDTLEMYEDAMLRETGFFIFPQEDIFTRMF